MILITIGEFIQTLRKEKGLSSRRLAKISGVSQPYISQLENGKNTKPSPEIIKKLANALNISYSELMKKAGYTDNDAQIPSVIEMNSLLSNIRSIKMSIEVKEYQLKIFLKREKEISKLNEFELKKLRYSELEMITDNIQKIKFEVQKLKDLLDSFYKQKLQLNKEIWKGFSEDFFEINNLLSLPSINYEGKMLTPEDIKMILNKIEEIKDNFSFNNKNSK